MLYFLSVTHFVISGWFFGDPHITTLDGHTYTFNGVGDYICLSVKNVSNALTIHSRMSKAHIQPNSSVVASKATVFSAFALTTIDDGALVEIYLNVSSKCFLAFPCCRS